jgi:hypothetical protein
LIKSAFIFDLKGLPDLEREYDLKGLALIYIVKLKGPAFSEG